MLRWFGTNTDVTARLAAENAFMTDLAEGRVLATSRTSCAIRPIRNAVQVMAFRNRRSMRRWARARRHPPPGRAPPGSSTTCSCPCPRASARRAPRSRPANDGHRADRRQPVRSARPLLAERRHGSRWLPGQPLPVNADDVRLARVFHEPPQQQRRSTQARQQRVHHAPLRGAPRGDELHVVVRDDGIGIAPEVHLPQVFEMFMRAGRPLGGVPAGSASGSRWSAGWSSCTAGPSPHTATVSVAARSARPAADREHSARAGPGCRNAAPQPSQNGAVRILVADDNRDNVETLALMLELHRGHEVATAHGTSGAHPAAHDAAPRSRSSTSGCRMNGYEVCRCAATAVQPRKCRGRLTRDGARRTTAGARAGGLRPPGETGGLHRDRAAARRLRPQRRGQRKPM